MSIDKVEIVAPNVQGAGWDLTARAMQKRSQKKNLHKTNHSYKQSRWQW
ncbi:hypothetical protein LQK80_25860 [Bacillus thuringiensis]|nr:hypothetical protein [Bacillus thuringiensis]